MNVQKLKFLERQPLLFEKVWSDASHKHKMKNSELMSQVAIGAVYIKKQK